MTGLAWAIETPSHCHPRGQAVELPRVLLSSSSEWSKARFPKGLFDMAYVWTRLHSTRGSLMDRTVKRDGCADSSKRQGVEINKRPYLSSPYLSSPGG